MATWGVGQNDPSQEVLNLREKLASKESTIAAYETQLLRKAEDNDELKQLYDEVVNKLRAETEKALSLEKDLRQCTEDLRHEKLSVQNLQATLNTAQQTVKSSNLETRELEATLETLSHQSNTHQQRCRILEGDKGKLEERVRELQSLLSQSPPSTSSKRKPTIRPRSSSLSNFRITTLETDINDLRTTLQQKEKELDFATKKLANVQAEANRLGNEKNALEKKTASQLAELETVVAEREEELNYLRDGAGGSREQELLERIEEDEAKISALETMLRSVKDIDAVERKLKQAESKLQEEYRRAQRVVQQHLQVKEENDNLLLELNTARSQIKELEIAMQERRRKSSLLDSCEDDDMDGILDTPNEADMTLPLADEGTVEYVGRLLGAIDRLRDERDSLRRDVQFLESESRFAIEALEAKLSASMATSSSGEATTRTMNQMKLEMDALHSNLEDIQLDHNAEVQKKDRELRRLGQALTAMGVVVRQSYSEAASLSQDSAMKEQVDDAVLKELEDKLDVTMLCLEAMTSQRDDLADTLRKQEDSWGEEMQGVRFSQQQSNRNIQDLSSQIDELTKTLEQVESERSSLALQVTNLEADLQDAQDELANAESRYSDLQFHQLSSMSSTEATMNLRTQIKELENRVLRRTEQLGIHQHDVRRLETNLRLQEERLNEMTMELEMVNAEKAAMVEDCADAREVRDEALRRIEELEEAGETLENAADETETTIVTLVGVVVDTISKARQAIRSAVSSSDVSHEEMQDAFDHIDELKEENGHLEHIVQKYNERINQLTAQIVNLEGQHASTVDATNGLKVEFQSQLMGLQDEIEALRTAKANADESHSAATWELETELDRLRQQLREAQESLLRRSSEVDSVQQTKDQGLELLQSKVSTLQTALEDAESQYRVQLKAKGEALEVLAESKQQAEAKLVEIQVQLSLTETEHEKATVALNNELVNERENLKQAQQSFDRLEGDRHKLIGELTHLQETLDAGHMELEAEKEHSTQLTQQYNQQLNALTSQVQELTACVHEERNMRQLEERDHVSILSTREGQYNAMIADLENLREDLDRAEGSRIAAEEERNSVQEQMTDLVAKIEQNKSLQRMFEGQAQERDRLIASLNAEISEIQTKLNNAEQANAKSTLNLSLLAAQHKREMADAQRELESLRSKNNLEQIIAELEERNEDMERLLKEKCAEIEENDDRTLEMLKDNKKLSTKVDSLTRKVQALQTKVATLKASSPKAEAVPAKPTPTSTSTRHRSATLTSAQPPAQPSFLQRPSMPSTSTSRPLSRVASGPSIPPRSKTPTPEQAPARVFSRTRTPEQVKSQTSPVGESTSVAGKKRRAPDDFEGNDGVPPQAFTAESVPKDDFENRTPRVRRVLSSLQSGFTPVRTFARPVVPLPSPRRNPVQTQASPFIADVTNSPLNVLPPLAFAPPSASKSNKRSWLGKIRGAGTSQGRS